MGFQDEEISEFYELIEGTETENPLSDGAFYLYIMLDSDVLEHYRSIYTIWDLLGDVGGLHSLL